MVQKNFGMRIGTRAQVFHGTAKQTSGGLQKCDLKKNKRGAIVSRRASARAKKDNRLVKAGFVTQRGKFGVVQKGGDENDLLRKVLAYLGYQQYVDKFIEQEITLKMLPELTKNEMKEDLKVNDEHVNKMFSDFQLLPTMTKMELITENIFTMDEADEMIKQLKKT